MQLIYTENLHQFSFVSLTSSEAYKKTSQIHILWILSHN